MLKVHIKGFGLIGSLLAWELTERKIDFSWHDEDHPSAWKASTGCIYPSGDPFDNLNYNLWLKKFSGDTTAPIQLFAESVDYGFTQKSIPHGNNSKELKVVNSVGNIKILNKQSMHFNVQKFVNFSRNFFFSVSTPVDPSGALVVHAHGFHKHRPTDYRWGWSIRCKVSGEVFDKHPRMCLNAKEGRFINAYLYPRPMTDDYYLGTHFIYQKNQKNLEIGNKVENIISHIKKVTDGQVDIQTDGVATVGWRPAYVSEFPHAFIQESNQMYITPKSANGLRHAPSYIKEIADAIQVQVYASVI